MTTRHAAARPRTPIPMVAIFRLKHGEKLRQVAKDMKLPKSTLARAYAEYRQRRGFYLNTPKIPSQNSYNSKPGHINLAT